MKSIVKGLLSVVSLGLCFSAQAEMEEGIHWSGDLRYRYEAIDKQDMQSSRHRIRARIKAKAQINDRVGVALRLATGDQTITSTNQTLDSYGNNKPFDLDLAYFKYKIGDQFSFSGGKMMLPIYSAGKTGILFDTDWTPEGVSFVYKYKFEKFKLFAKGAHLKLQEGKKGEDDVDLNTVQVGVKIPMNESTLKIGYGHLDFANIKGSQPYSDSGNSFELGELNQSENIFMYDYQLQQMFLSYRFKLQDMDVELFAEQTKNTKIDDQNMAMVYGFGLGKAKKKGSISLKADYRTVEKDATVGALADGDSLAGTDGKGVVVQFVYAPSDNSTVGIVHYAMKKNVSVEETDFQKTQLNYVLKF